MLNIQYGSNFLKTISKIKDNSIREQIKKQIIKITENPEIGKPMRYDRKGTREVYVQPFRLSYVYLHEEEKIIFLEIYHKKKQ
ncbi:MAG: type II toxin-antitoxin system RelE/ParE family toxin [archaeon]|nr:type II toxin-antitoxin system RelE/ParE family toxin [archaeon]